MPGKNVYSCYTQYKKGNCKASAANACSNYFSKGNDKIEYNAEIKVWRKHSNQPYMIILKDIKKDEEIVVRAYGNSFNYK